VSDDATKLEKAKAATKPSALSRACNEQEMRFAQAFVANGGDRIAALRTAGYDPKSKASGEAFARKLLGRPHVAQAIATISGNAALVAKHVEAHRPEDAPPVATADELVRFWTDVVRMGEMKDPAAMRVRLRASENLARHHGILVDKNEQAAPITINANAGSSSDAPSDGLHVSISFVDNGRGPREPAAIDATPKGDA
jgi:hypothetical protein